MCTFAPVYVGELCIFAPWCMHESIGIKNRFNVSSQRSECNQMKGLKIYKV